MGGHNKQERNRLLDLTDEVVCELKERGFRKGVASEAFRANHPGLNVVQLKAFSTAARYSVSNLFGERMQYYYLKEKGAEFSRFLEEKFFSSNPSPSNSMLKSFSNLLHMNGLHWSGCIDLKRSPREEMLNALRFNGGKMRRHDMSLYFAHRRMKADLVDKAYEALGKQGIVEMTLERKGKAGPFRMMYRLKRPPPLANR